MSERYHEGLQIRREVLGAEYVDSAIDASTAFAEAFQVLVTEWCWGSIWSRPGLERKTRSMLNVAMLAALNKPAELGLHVRGALTNGVTVEEIKEILLQVTIYCGVPAGLEAFKVADKVIQEEAGK
ncbi:MAG TPA: carboxymuconolactone decarboxylase family protein [Rhizobiaceae bacterium]|nr:carboxymuconolactone decarboxylase family protein [Rhizobiaceae bacterium]